MPDDPVHGYSTGNWRVCVPVVVESDHPGYPAGSRFDWGYVMAAVGDGYEVTLSPADTNRSNCSHEQGYRLSVVVLHSAGKEFNTYYCPTCHAEKYVPRTNKPPKSIPKPPEASVLG